MTDSFLPQQYVDHYLQAEVIQQLLASDEPLKFSELKEEGVDNSLFMYHAKKLEKRGLIERAEGRFRITSKGARWANYAGQSFNKSPVPRILVQCVIRSGDQVLLAKRTGAMKDLLNGYLLPGRKHDYGISAKDVAEDLLKDLFTEGFPPPELLTVAEVIVEYSDKFTHHSISHIHEVILPDTYQPNRIEKFEYVWVESKLISDQPIADLLKKEQVHRPCRLLRYIQD